MLRRNHVYTLPCRFVFAKDAAAQLHTSSAVLPAVCGDPFGESIRRRTKCLVIQNRGGVRLPNKIEGLTISDKNTDYIWGRG